MCLREVFTVRCQLSFLVYVICLFCGHFRAVRYAYCTHSPSHLPVRTVYITQIVIHLVLEPPIGHDTHSLIVSGRF